MYYSGLALLQNDAFLSLRNAPELILAQCPLTTATDGQSITARGEVRDEPHDTAFEMAGCGERSCWCSREKPTAALVPMN